MIAAVHVIDVYLDEKHEAERNHIRQLAESKDPSSTEVLRGYVREAMRWFHLAFALWHDNNKFYLGLNSQSTGLWRDVAIDVLIPQGDGLAPLKVQAGDRIWASFKTLTSTYVLRFIILEFPNFFFVQPKEFPNPTTFDPNRPPKSYNLHGAGFHNCAGVEYVVQTIAEILRLRVVFKLRNVRRASSDAGKLSGFTEVVNETETKAFINPNGTSSPWTGSMYLVVSRRLWFFLVSSVVYFGCLLSAAIINSVALKVTWLVMILAICVRSTSSEDEHILPQAKSKEKPRKEPRCCGKKSTCSVQS